MEWYKLKGYEESHLITKCGRVKRVGCDDLLWSDNGNGYFTVGIHEQSVNLRRYVHRLVATNFIKKPSEEHTQVNHIDGDKSNNYYSNLEWVTPSENIKKAHAQGQMKNRALVGSITRVHEDIVAAMYREVLEGNGITKTATKYGVPRTTLSSIVNKRSRSSVTDIVDEEFTNV